MDQVVLQSECGRDTVTLQPLAAATAGAVVCAIWHDIESAPLLPASIHANTFASLNIVLEGSVAVAASRITLPGTFVTGPMTKPLDTLISAPARSLCLVIQPWLLRQWFGLAPREMVDKLRGLNACPQVPQWIADLREEIAAGLRPGSGELGQRLARHLADITAPATCEAHSAALLQHQGVALAARACGTGARQFHRAFVHHFGLPPGSWLKMRRFEEALVQLAEHPSDGRQPLAHSAAAVGYADQSHMTRAFAALCGVSPRAARDSLDKGSITRSALSAARLWHTA